MKQKKKSSYKHINVFRFHCIVYEIHAINSSSPFLKSVTIIGSRSSYNYYTPHRNLSKVQIWCTGCFRTKKPFSGERCLF